MDTFTYNLSAKRQIPLDFIGVGASLCDCTYRDKYIEALENEYPFIQIVGESAGKLKDGVISETYRFNAPLHISYTNDDSALKKILIGSARADRWSALVIDDEKSKGIDPEFLSNLKRSALLAESFGLTKRYRTEGADIVIPLQHYAELCSQADHVLEGNQVITQYCRI